MGKVQHLEGEWLIKFSYNFYNTFIYLPTSQNGNFAENEDSV